MDYDDDDDYCLTSEEAAAFLKLSRQTLDRLRVTGEGPRFTKSSPSKNGKVIYRKSDLIKWLDSRSFRSTSEYD